jgi:DNA-directed RNA polymerase subunit RPC12/RpoP
MSIISEVASKYGVSCTHCGSKNLGSKGCLKVLDDGKEKRRFICKDCGRSSTLDVCVDTNTNTNNSNTQTREPEVQQVIDVNVSHVIDASSGSEEYPLLTVDDIRNNVPIDKNKNYTFVFMNVTHGGSQTTMRGTWESIRPIIENNYVIDSFNSSLGCYAVHMGEQRAVGTKG